MTHGTDRTYCRYTYFFIFSEFNTEFYSYTKRNRRRNCNSIGDLPCITIDGLSLMLFTLIGEEVKFTWQ